MSDVVEMAELVAGVVGGPSDDVDVKHGGRIFTFLFLK